MIIHNGKVVLRELAADSLKGKARALALRYGIRFYLFMFTVLFMWAGLCGANISIQSICR